MDGRVPVRIRRAGADIVASGELDIVCFIVGDQGMVATQIATQGTSLPGGLFLIFSQGDVADGERASMSFRLSYFAL